MNYVARMTTRCIWTDHNGTVRNTFRFTYIPAFDIRDAKDICDGLRKGGVPHYDDGNTKYVRSYDVVAMVRTGKGNVYLDIATMEQIADEFTSTDTAQVAAE